jgi:hypothetical protein
MKMIKHYVHPNDIFRLFRGDAKDRKVVAQYWAVGLAVDSHRHLEHKPNRYLDLTTETS